MYAVVGTWRTDPGLAEMRRQMLNRIVEGVRLTPGFVHGYWADSAPVRSHTFIMFADRASAEAFADDVRNNLENQVRAGVRNEALDIAEVVATA
jgi:quinol monooxygenase YgiN